MKATKQTMINDLLQMDSNIAGLLMGHGLHCIAGGGQERLIDTSVSLSFVHAI